MNITPISTTNKTSNHQINFSSKKIDGKKVFEELSSLYNQTEKLFKDDKAHQGLDWTKNTYFDFQVFYKNINPRKKQNSPNVPLVKITLDEKFGLPKTELSQIYRIDLPHPLTIDGEAYDLNRFGNNIRHLMLYAKNRNNIKKGKTDSIDVINFTKDGKLEYSHSMSRPKPKSIKLFGSNQDHKRGYMFKLTKETESCPKEVHETINKLKEHLTRFIKTYNKP